MTYFGGNGVDHGTGIAVDPNLNTYLVGDTTSTNLEVARSAAGQPLNGPPDAFVVKLGTAADLSITCVAPVVSPLGTVSAGNQVTITFTIANEGPDLATNIYRERHGSHRSDFQQRFRGFGHLQSAERQRGGLPDPDAASRGPLRQSLSR